MSSPLPNPTKYFSPGIQIGFDFSDGFFITSQITAGLIDSGFKDGTFPGITLGFKKYKNQTLGFVDLQMSFYYCGVGIGKFWNLSSTEKSRRFSMIDGFRTKFWADIFVLGTYDNHIIIGKKVKHSFGTFGVFPLVFSEGF